MVVGGGENSFVVTEKMKLRRRRTPLQLLYPCFRVVPCSIVFASVCSVVFAAYPERSAVVRPRSHAVWGGESTQQPAQVGQRHVKVQRPDEAVPTMG
jgi:hypothetical protein